MRSFTNLIDAGTGGVHRPVVQDVGMDCDKVVWNPTRIDSRLAAFPGKYVTLNFETSGWSAWFTAGSPTAETYYNAMSVLLEKVLAAGKTPVVPMIPWPNWNEEWEQEVEAFNAQIEKLYQAYPDVVRGPDLYNLLKGKSELYLKLGDVHPNDAGKAVIRRACAEVALANVYSK